MKCDACCIDDAVGTRCREWEVVLCDECNLLFEARALRPDMWQKLAYKIGPNEYPLRDDFYDDESGMPCQPDVEIDEDYYSTFKIDPSEKNESPNSYALYYFTQHFIWDKNKIILPVDWSEALFEICRVKIGLQGNSDAIKARAYQLLSWLPYNADIGLFVEDRWQEDCDAAWFGIDKAAIAHLSSPTAIELIKAALLRMQPKAYYHDYISAISGVSDRSAIPALREIVIKREPPLLDKLGAYYRCLNPSWDDIRADIESGRPMSLLAIDALWIETGNQYRAWFKGRGIVPLVIPVEECTQLLRDYYKVDKAPRVAEAIERAMECLAGGA